MMDTKERFKSDVRDHVITILHDDPPYRHIRLARPGSCTYAYEIVTYPGYLCYSGDMGCYVWSRVSDMFSFFRGPIKGDLKINPSYWGEKLQAISRFGEGYQELDKDRLIRLVQEARDEFLADRIQYADEDTDPAEYAEDLNTELDCAIFDPVEDIQTTDQAHMLLNDFVSDYGFELVDTFEWHFEKFTHHYLWACYAVVWGIRQYDIAREITAPQTAEPARMEAEEKERQKREVEEAKRVEEMKASYDRRRTEAAEALQAMLTDTCVDSDPYITGTQVLDEIIAGNVPHVRFTD